MPAAWLLYLLLAPTNPAQEIPVPPGHRTYGPPLREEVIPGWETFIEDIPPSKDCANIGMPMVVPLNPPHREKAVAMLRKRPFRRLSEAEASRMVETDRRDGQALATTVFQKYLDDMRRSMERGWSLADKKNLEELTARFTAGDHRAYRPYLVRAVSKFGDGHGGAPFMVGDLCGGDLHLQTLTFSYTVPPSVRVPAVVFLPRPPKRIISTARYAW
jgi:hypothetical protein